MALALIHHLTISNNLPFSYVAEYFASISKNLIIEFVPKEDKKVQVLLATRKDIFVNYNQVSFEKEFGLFFDIQDSVRIKDSKRILYFMSKIGKIEQAFAKGYGGYTESGINGFGNI